jgi:hypothetical protein
MDPSNWLLDVGVTFMFEWIGGEGLAKVCAVVAACNKSAPRLMNNQRLNLSATIMTVSQRMIFRRALEI